MSSTTAKPLGTKAYGSIPHLPGSRLGPGDHHCHAGQAELCQFRTRHKDDVVWVEEKLDGSCCSVARLQDGSLVALGRAGWPAQSSPYEQHQLFAAWVRDNEWRFEFLSPGERVVGEWLAMAHGTRYCLVGRQPFVAFDLMRGKERATRAEFGRRLIPACVATAPVLAFGPCSVEKAMERLGPRGYYGAVDEAEGAVWRVESGGRVDFLAKYVRPGKVDGRYFEGEPVWNWRP